MEKQIDKILEKLEYESKSSCIKYKILKLLTLKARPSEVQNYAVAFSQDI